MSLNQTFKTFWMPRITKPKRSSEGRVCESRVSRRDSRLPGGALGCWKQIRKPSVCTRGPRAQRNLRDRRCTWMQHRSPAGTSQEGLSPVSLITSVSDQRADTAPPHAGVSEWKLELKHAAGTWVAGAKPLIQSPCPCTHFLPHLRSPRDTTFSHTAGTGSPQRTRGLSSKVHTEIYSKSKVIFLEQYY